jgi:hypothetical protein
MGYRDQPAAELSGLSADALPRGLDTPAFRKLAGAERDDNWRIKLLLDISAHDPALYCEHLQTLHTNE